MACVADAMGDRDSNLMSLLQYNHKDDLLIHLGDLCAKGPHSNELVTRFAAANMTGVRGNNDQKVIGPSPPLFSPLRTSNHRLDWYSWFEWVKSHPGGDVWLAAKMKQNVTPRQSKAMKMYKSLKYRFPKDWEWNGDHYQIAAYVSYQIKWGMWSDFSSPWYRPDILRSKLSPSDYAYLTSLPIVIHLPSLHTFVVHAGLLPMDPAHHPRWLGQPLGHPPDSLPETNATAEDIVRARFEQESALLTDIEPNTDRYIKLNIRDVHDYQPVRRGPKDHDDNEPWSELWNRVIKRCRGFESDKDLQRVGGVEAVRMRSPLPCYPITVVYSHASGRGLDLKRWSKGLDTGCVNGNGLTAMILGKARNRYPPLPTDTQKFPEDDEDERDVQIKFGEGHKARLVSVSCPTPPPVDFNKRRS